jgi:hypothetical protein
MPLNPPKLLGEYETPRFNLRRRGGVDMRHGLALLKGARGSRWHPGVVCEKHAEAA